MARLRKGVAYRKLERPYTRRSKYRSKNYAKSNPNNLIVKYEQGSPNKEFDVKFELIAYEDVQLRHNCIEAARKSANRYLENRLAKNFFLKIRAFPHHILRENPLASGAGADRLSTGMKMSFGKPIGIAAQCKKGKVLVECSVERKDVAHAVTALKRMSHKFPIRCLIQETVLRK
jgi:large subunit ribosomal protein L10e